MSSDEDNKESGSDKEEDDSEEEGSKEGSDEEDGSGSESGSKEGSDEDGSESGSESEGSKKKKEDEEEQIVPKDLKGDGDSEFKKIFNELGSLQLDIDSFMSTLSSSTQTKLGFQPNNQIQQIIGQNNNYVPQTLTATNFRNTNQQGQFQQQAKMQQQYPQTSPRSQYNTYGNYRFQKDQQQIPQQLQQQQQQMNRPMAESIEDVAKLREALNKPNNNNNYREDDNNRSGNWRKEDENMPASERFRLNKESQNIIDNYYHNLYRRKSPFVKKDYSNVQDLYKQRPKSVYDEDEVKKGQMPYPSKDQKFSRNSGFQQAPMPSGSLQNRQKIDDAIKILLGKR